MANISRIIMGLEEYFNEYNNFPTKLIRLVETKTRSKIEYDPVTKESYDYCVGNEGFVIGAQLENENSPLMEKSDDNSVKTKYCNVNTNKTCGSKGYLCLSTDYIYKKYK